MKLCMFTPRELQLQRGWPGLIEGDVVYQLAAQTLESFFTGGVVRDSGLLLLQSERDLRAGTRRSASNGDAGARLRARARRDYRRGRAHRRFHGDERLVGARSPAQRDEGWARPVEG